MIEYGNLGQKGTSRDAVKYLSRWIVSFSKSKDFGILCEYLSCEDVTLDRIKACINCGGCVNLRTYQGCEHYVTVTKIDEEYVYIFDPYYYPGSHYKDNNCVFYVANKPFNYNRKVKMERFLSEREFEFALGPIDKRECVLFNRNYNQSK